jgi:hypothetical protein
MDKRTSWLVSGAVVALLGCGGETSLSPAADASVSNDAASADSGGGQETGSFDGAVADAGADAAPPDCTYDDGGATLDASSRFQGSCDGGCPTGTVCAVQIGGVAGGGGEYCAPIVDRCKNDVTCACLSSCVCGSSFGRAERCNDTQQKGTVLECDNGIR